MAGRIGLAVLFFLILYERTFCFDSRLTAVFLWAFSRCLQNAAQPFTSLFITGFLYVAMTLCATQNIYTKRHEPMNLFQ
jgi:hypothetical protein